MAIGWDRSLRFSARGSGYHSVMSEASCKQSAPPMLVFSDLDGTLLDHDTYSHAAADSALARLADLGIPCVLTTSKTRAEVLTIRADLGLDSPFIVENGGAVLLSPTDEHFDLRDFSLDEIAGLRCQRFGRPRAEILAILHDAPEFQGFRFRGFAQLSPQAIAQLTGLSLPEALAASRRDYCEPIIWDDTPDKTEQFADALEQHQLKVLRGGRFWHVMDQAADKAVAMAWLCAHERRGSGLTTVALGDSHNDVGMLQQADIAVLVRSRHHAYPAAQGRRRTIKTLHTGPGGWAEAIHQILDSLDDN